MPFIWDFSGYFFLWHILRHIWCQYFSPVCHVVSRRAREWRCVCVLPQKYPRAWHTHFAYCTHFGAFMWPVGSSDRVCQLPAGRSSRRSWRSVWHAAVQKRVSVLLMARVECVYASVCVCVLCRHKRRTENGPVYIYCCPDLANIMASSGGCATVPGSRWGWAGACAWTPRHLSAARSSGQKRIAYFRAEN